MNLEIYLYCVVKLFMKEDRCALNSLVSLTDELIYLLFSMSMNVIDISVGIK